MLIRLKAKCWAKDQGINFKASLHWCQRFMKQHDLSVRRKTTITQKLPEEPVEGGNTEEGEDDDSV